MVEKKKTDIHGNVLPEIHPPKWLKGFIDFIREQGVVGFAVGLILGLASKNLVDSFVFNIVNPIVGVFLGSNNLDGKFICLNYEGSACVSKLNYGRFLSEIISFIIICAVVYFLIKGLKLEKLDKKKTDDDKVKSTIKSS